MIDTQKYIRESLQPYADNKHFGFSKPGLKNTKTIDHHLSPQALTRTLIVGNPIHPIENSRRFLSPNTLKMPAIDSSLLTNSNVKFNTIDHKEGSKTMRGNSKAI